MGKQKADVLILGAGIIGMTLAHELQRAGRQVTVLDKSEPGLGCSYGNAGWITPCFAMPLPQPGMFWKSIGWLLNPDSPLYIKPQPSLRLAKWMWSFLMAMNRRRLQESVAALTDISKFSLQSYRELASRTPHSFGFKQKGLLMVSGTQVGLRAAELEMQLMHERGIPGELLSAEQVLHMEPALKPVISGGVFFPSEAHAEPLATVQVFVEEFREAGGQIHSRTEVFDFVVGDGKIQEVLTTRGRFQADIIVMAAGTWSHALARQLQLSVPVLGGKGYSVIVDAPPPLPRHPIMVVEKKLAVTPREGSVRLAGTLELVDDRDDSITPRRVRTLLKSAEEYLHFANFLSESFSQSANPSARSVVSAAMATAAAHAVDNRNGFDSSALARPEIREVWRGLRPCTPDGVPIIGFSRRWSNLFYNFGHQMLGLQSAPGSARLACDLILGNMPSFTDPRPFRPSRYNL